jgi:hypothetical protein
MVGAWSRFLFVSSLVFSVTADSPPALSASARFPVSGKSFGGAFRQGPSMSTRQIGSIRERDPVTIVKNAGNEMNGYDWFQIRFKGSTGYQWGGILCSDIETKGIYQTCATAGF